MAVNALRDDLFSLIEAFASPRQGAGDNVALTQQAATQAQQEGPPQPPPPPQQGPLPFQPPVPVASRKLPGGDMLTGGGGSDTLAGGDRRDAITTPPPPTPAPAPVTGATGFAGGPTAAPTPFAPEAPAADPAQDIMAMAREQMAAAQKQQEANRRMAGLQQLVSGGQLMLAGATASPSMRGVLANAASQSASAAGSAGGDGGGKLAGMPSMAEMINLQKMSMEAAESQSHKKRLPGLAKQLGISVERLEGMAPKDVSELIRDVSKPNIEKEVREDGSVVIWDKNNPAATRRELMPADPYKVEDQGFQRQTSQLEGAEGARKASEHERLTGQRDLTGVAGLTPEAKAAMDKMSDSDRSALLLRMNDPNLPLEQRRTAVTEFNALTSRSAEERQERAQPSEIAGREATTAQTRQQTADLVEKQGDRAAVNAMVTDDAQAKALADQLNVDVPTLRALHRSGKLDDALSNAVKGTALYQDYIKAGKPGPYEAWFKKEQASKAPVAAPGKGFVDADVKSTNEAITKAGSALERLPEARKRYDMLARGEGLVGGFYGRPSVQNVIATTGDLLGLDVKGITDTQTLQNSVVEQSISRAKELGVNPTDNDVKVLRQALGGDTTQTRDALTQMAQVNVRHSMQAVLNANAKVGDALKTYGSDPDAQAVLARQHRKLEELPDHVNAMFPQSASKGLVDALKSDAPEQDKLDTKAAFDAKYGKGMADYVIAKRGGP